MLGDAKYIVFEDEDGNMIPVIFPAIVTHRDVANRVRPWKPVTAGFVTNDLRAHGESLSLNLKADERNDTRLILKILNRID